MGNHGKNIEEIKANEETNQLHGDWLVVKRKSSNKSTKNHGKWGKESANNIRYIIMIGKIKNNNVIIGMQSQKDGPHGLSSPSNYKPMGTK